MLRCSECGSEDVEWSPEWDEDYGSVGLRHHPEHWYCANCGCIETDVGYFRVDEWEEGMGGDAVLDRNVQ